MSLSTREAMRPMPDNPIILDIQGGDGLELSFEDSEELDFDSQPYSRGEKGDKGDQGDPGPAGFSPTATVVKVGDTATITITDKDGTTTATVKDGADGASDWDDITNKPNFATVATSGSYDDLSDKPTIPVVPTNVSAFTNDAGYLTSQDISGKINEPAVEGTNGQVLTTDGAGGRTWTTVQGGGTVDWDDITDKPTFATVATSGSYNDLSNKPTIPSAVTESTVAGWGFTKNTGDYSKPVGGIPKTDLDNAVQASLGLADSALQSYSETDPTVPSWAKQVSKPTYTKSEVGLGNVDNVQQYSASNPPPYPVTSVNGSTGAVTVTVPTKVSDLTNDSGFISSYTETDPIFTASDAYGISSADIAVWNGKQNALVAGIGISISGNVISATGGGGGSEVLLPRLTSSSDGAGNVTLFLALDPVDDGNNMSF